MSWVHKELASADLGDVRRNRRFVAIVEDLAASPESSVPLASCRLTRYTGSYAVLVKRGKIVDYANEGVGV